MSEQVKFSREIRAGTAEDIEAMALLTERTNADRAGEPLPSDIPYASQDYSDLRERINYDGYWSWLAFDNGHLAGFVNGYPGTWKGEDDGTNSEYLWLLMVDPDHQGRGLGRELLKTAADSAEQRGKDSMVLYVATSNTRAIELYESEGYQQIGTAMSERQGELAKYQLELN